MSDSRVPSFWRNQQYVSLLKPVGCSAEIMISILYFKHIMQEMILNVWFLHCGLQWAWRWAVHAWHTENTVIQSSFAICYVFCSSRKKKCNFFLWLCKIVVFCWTVAAGALSWQLMLVSPVLLIWAPFNFKEFDTASFPQISASSFHTNDHQSFAKSANVL